MLNKKGWGRDEFMCECNSFNDFIASVTFNHTAKYYIHT